MHADTLLTIATIAGLLITAATVAGGAFRVSHHAAALAAYKAANEALEARARARDEAIKELQDMQRLKDAQISELQAQVGVLTDLATGRSVVEDLRGPVAELVGLATRAQSQLTALKELVTRGLPR